MVHPSTNHSFFALTLCCNVNFRIAGRMKDYLILSCLMKSIPLKRTLRAYLTRAAYSPKTLGKERLLDSKLSLDGDTSRHQKYPKKHKGTFY